MSLLRKAQGRVAGARSRAVMRSVSGNGGRASKNAVPGLFKMPEVFPPTFPDLMVNVRDHGALENSDCTNAIAAAIDACARAGGGGVLIPPGQWLTGAIHLASNIDLHLAEGAVVRFSADPQKYLPPVFVRWGGQECYNYSPLIYARSCQNIAVTGRGRLLGQGRPWWSW